MNNTERIAEIRERCATATGASWIRKNGQILCPLGSGDLLKLGGGFDANDAEFVACARKDIPYLLSEVERYKEWVNDLQSGMYVNCVYCGHKYGPESEVPASMADALKEHIEHCPEHPASQLKSEVDRLTAELEQKTREVERYKDIWSANYLGTPYEVDDQAPTQSMPEDMRDRFRESYTGQRFDALSAEGVSG